MPAGSGGLSCRLPVVTYSTNGQSSQVGFLTFPGGTFAVDRGAPSASKGNGFAYDRGFNRWLPVDWRFVSDDGTKYVYATYPDTSPSPGASSVIHLVTVATGADRVVTRTGQYVINDYSGNGVYLTEWIGGHDGPGPEIGWVLNPSTGAVRGLSRGQKYGYWVAAGAGWRTDYNPADPSVHNGPTGGNRVTRIDLGSGAEATWFYQQGADWVQVVGFDRQGHPLIASAVASSGTQVVDLWLLTDASHRTRIYSGPQFTNWMMADANGIWLSDGATTYLYAGGSLRQMASTGGQIAGGCH
jgi:hypothetical protein